jgi:hypothetical protein
VRGLPREKYQIQTKWYVVPDNVTNLLHPKAAPAKMLKETLERLKLDYVGKQYPSGLVAHSLTVSQIAT